MSAAQYPDADISFKVKQALYFTNAITGLAYTISDYDNAHCVLSSGTDYFYDELVSLRALWSIHLEMYQQTVTRGDTPATTRHLSTIYEQQFLELLSSRYPGLVQATPTRSGVQYTFIQTSYPGGDIGANDGRELATSGVTFDQSNQFANESGDWS